MILYFYPLGLLAPYFDRLCFLSFTPDASSVPLTMWYLTPGRSFTLPPLSNTTECSWILWPIPGIYAVTSNPEVKRTLATFINAELGFLGVVVYTLVQTPFLCGQLFNAGYFVFFFIFTRSERINCWIVGISLILDLCCLELSKNFYILRIRWIYFYLWSLLKNRF